MNRNTHAVALKKNSFDLLVIGGGATGCGIALDAATRGLKVALVERNDFASGTSSRSTKLIHGGVRYLEQAVKKLDRGELSLVHEALQERSHLLKLAPHLVNLVGLLTPLYHWWEVPYYTSGLKVYDWLAGRHVRTPSRLVSKKTALSLCPPLKGDGLLGAVLYYDGQFDDARLCVALARTAERLGATLVNHVEAAGFMERGGRLVGAKVRDSLTGDTWEVRAKAIVNATGPMADTIRTQDDPSARPLLNTSSGAHLVLKGGVLKDHVGILIPRTQDDRVLFVLPWLGHTLIGTTDEARKPSFDPTPSHDEVEFILSEVNKHTSLPARREDILAAWAGLRPLVSARAGSTAALSRDYHVEVSEKGLLTIVGGKWTTYRRMAETAVDRICEENGWKVQKSASATQVLFGGDGWNPKGWQECLEKFPIDEGTARYWNRAYGTEGATVGHYCSQVERGFDRLHPAHPVVRGEVAYAKTFEWAVTPEDFLARRTRFQFLDERATKAVFPDVERLMGE